MTLWICRTCGVEYADSPQAVAEPPPRRPRRAA